MLGPVFGPPLGGTVLALRAFLILVILAMSKIDPFQSLLTRIRFYTVSHLAPEFRTSITLGPPSTFH